MIFGQMYLYDTGENLIGILENDKLASPTIGGQATAFYNCKIREQLNGAYTLEFTVPYDSPQAGNIISGGYVVIADANNTYQLFHITRIEDTHSDIMERRVFCEHASIELMDDYTSYTWDFKNYNFTMILNDMLHARWQKGSIVEDYTTRSASFEYKSNLEVLRACREIWGGDLSFRVAITGTNNTFTRYIDYAPKKGTDTGRRFEYSKDILEITRTIDTTNLKTAMIGIGKDGLVFDNAVWVYPTNPADKPTGQRFVGNEGARTTYGRPFNGDRRHLYGVYRDDSIEDAGVLLNRTWEYLLTVSNPVVTYTMKAVDLQKLTGVFYTYQVGDTIQVIDRDLGIQLTTRIVEKIDDLDRPELSEIVLGNKVDTYSNTTTTALNTAEDVKNKPATTTTTSTDPVDTSRLTGNINTAVNNVVANANNFTITDAKGLISLDGSNVNRGVQVSGGMLRLTNAVDAQGQHVWRLAGDGDGMDATEIKRGNLYIASTAVQMTGNITATAGRIGHPYQSQLSANHTTNLSLSPAQTWYNIPFANAFNDNQAEWDATNKVFKVKEAGVYLVNMGVRLSGFPTTNASILVALYKNGAEYQRVCQFVNPTTGAVHGTGTAMAFCSANDTLQMTVYVTTTCTAEFANQSTYCKICRIA